MSLLSRFFRRRKYGTRPPSRILTFFSRRKSQPRLLRFGTHATRSRRRRIVIVVMSIFALAVLFTVATQTSIFTVKRITVRGDTGLSAENATALLSGWLGQNIIFVKTAEVEDYIQKEYPTIENLSVSRRLPDRLSIRADDFPVSWVLTKVGSGSVGRFLLNTAGYVTEAATPENAVGLPVLEMVSDINLSAKTNVLDPPTLARLSKLGANIKSRFDLKVLKYKVLDIARELHLLLENNWVLKLTLDQDWDSALTNLGETLRGQDISQLNFEYIDLRVPDKIFFKERE